MLTNFDSPRLESQCLNPWSAPDAWAFSREGTLREFPKNKTLDTVLDGRTHFFNSWANSSRLVKGRIILKTGVVHMIAKMVDARVAMTDHYPTAYV